MIFKFLEKTITIDCFVSEKEAFLKELYPIQPSHKYIPNYWKSIPKSSFDWDKMNSVPTAKSCSGIMETFRNGYIQPLWSDLAVKVDEEGKWKYQFSDFQSGMDFHPSDQIPNFYPEHIIFKIKSPWIIRTSKKMKLALLDPFFTHNFPKPYIIPWGLLNTNSFNTMTPHIFFFVPKKEINFIVKSGMPILHILPLTENKTKLNIEVLSQNEYTKIQSYAVNSWSSKFFNRFKAFNNFQQNT